MFKGGRSAGKHLQRMMIAAAVVSVAAAVSGTHLSATTTAVPTCKVGKTVTIKGKLAGTKEDSYKLLPFKVAEGVSKLTISYSYTGSSTVLDLAVWDQQGAFSYKGFRGWSGSRQGRSDDSDEDGEPDQPPVVIQANKASRNFIPEPIKPGTWNIELGGGNIDTDGTSYAVKVKCDKVPAKKSPAPDPVDPAHVANPEPGWYFGDFHMHAFHSNLKGPSQSEFVEYASGAGLDFFPITEYQINRHWNEWGSTAAANPDLIFWPGREVITYFGHAGIIGETPGMVEYRHGFKDVTMGDIQAGSVERGALFQINHPTTYPAPFDDLCRGCAWEMDDAIDFDLVDTIEVVNVGVRANGNEGIKNPFVDTAIEFWEDKILNGYFIAPVGGSDDKLGPDYGIPATAVYATELSREGLKEGIQAGHVWIAAQGRAQSSVLGFTATAGDQTVMFGDTLQSATADFTVHVEQGMGETLWIYRDGVNVTSVPITSDDFTYEFAGEAAATDNPLGSYYRVETHDPSSLISTFGMPIFLVAP